MNTEILHLAKLAKLNLTEEEQMRFGKQIDGVFELVKVLDEVDTNGVLETDQVTGLSGVLRQDVGVKSGIEEDIIGISPMGKVAGQIAINGLME